ncbi:hypothetical protein P4O66_004447 [Electrophorus voltai]|uniref:Otogelin-like n=1 Tax=Electrophorus voltai TaxID=2609070 RepID=A0AAD8ZPY4_9TELE|nr:hypothetical protein P4O66_004447 [Electrophorus voltai]
MTPEKETSLTPTASSTTTEGVVSPKVCMPPYSEVVDECTKLICVSGQLLLFNKSQSCPYDSSPPNCGLLGFAVQVNGDKCCPKWTCPCRCSVFPDLNVVTFDGNNVAIFKAASYVVTRLPNETISILVQECHSTDSTVIWNFTHLCLTALNITHEANEVLINRIQRHLYVNSRYAKPRFKKYGFEVLDTGNMYLIRSPAGLKIQWFHSTGMMVIETDTCTNKLSTMGLCGCCDGNPLNDLTLSNGTVVAETEDPAVFIDSWQVPNTTSYVPPATFCEVWVRDSEYVNNPCVALAAYVASCNRFNICIEWRSPHYCPFMCPENLQYQACLSACTAVSCPNQDFEYHVEQCSGLSEGFPDCASVELLTVDTNSTERCCPVYHCLCEPSRCSVMTCPVGMTVVSTVNPEQCCPSQTCECACEKITWPKCSLGESLQLDRTFLTDPANQCSCKQYQCVRDAVCIDGERGVMRPGQTLMEHTALGVCYTTRCTRTLDPDTGFYRIQASSTNCTAQCQPNQVYVPPKDQSACCGLCKNVSCVQHSDNGSLTLYKQPGKSWVSDCMRYDCADTQSGPVLVSYSYSCPPFNETECMKVNIVSCDGKCPSASIYNYNINTYARFCKCCREMGLQRRSVQLYCSGNSSWVSYSIQEPTDCSCQWS